MGMDWQQQVHCPIGLWLYVYEWWEAELDVEFHLEDQISPQNQDLPLDCLPWQIAY